VTAPPTEPPRQPPPQSPWRIVARRLLRNRAALLGGGILLVFYFVALFAAPIAPYSPYATQSSVPDHPPHRLRFVDREGRFHWRPFVYRYELTDLLRRHYAMDVGKRYPIRFFVRGDRYTMWWFIKSDWHLFGLEGGAADNVRLHLLGTDRTGRDIFSRIIHGSQISLSIGLIGIAITMTIGMLVGGLSGYFGGWIDSAMMRLTELIMSVPDLYLILALRAAFSSNNPLLLALLGMEPGQHLGSAQIYLLIIVILGLVGWGGTARVVRGQVLAVRDLDYIQAARALGASRPRIILRHVLPNTFTYVIVAATLAVPGYILGEVALSFLGVGIEEPEPSWGLMLQDGQNLRTLTQAPWVLAPGVFIFVTVFAFNFLGDGLRDALDPKAVDQA